MTLTNHNPKKLNHETFPALQEGHFLLLKEEQLGIEDGWLRLKISSRTSPHKGLVTLTVATITKMRATKPKTDEQRGGTLWKTVLFRLEHRELLLLQR